MNFIKILLLLQTLLFTDGLKITCGGKRHRPAFDSSIFGGCFVSKGEILYEILGAPPANITGEYGAMILNGTFDCELEFNLKQKHEGVYQCGVLFLGKNNQTRKAVFSHFKIEKKDWSSPAPTQKTTIKTPTTFNDSFDENINLRNTIYGERKIHMTIAGLQLVLFTVAILLIAKTLNKRNRTLRSPPYVSPDLHQREPLSYPTTPLDRAQANRTLSSLELMRVPSPPPLSLSFLPTGPLVYSETGECDREDCPCLDRRE